MNFARVCFVLAVLTVSNNCSITEESTQSPIDATLKSSSSKAISSLLKQPDSLGGLHGEKAPSGDCMPLSESLPWFPDLGVVVTHLLGSCRTLEGNKGYLKTSSWIAMAFPCTGGGGKTRVYGNFYAPKLVSFPISNDCPTQARDPLTIANMVRERLNLDPSARMLALNPFAVQYWNLDNDLDQDSGFTVDFRTIMAKRNLWRRFRGKEDIPLVLFGRENAWLKNRPFMKVLANLKIESNSTFILQINGVEILDSEKQIALKEKCESLRPRRKCHEIF